MKKLLLILACAFIGQASFAQGKVIESYLDKFKDNDEFVKVSVSSRMFSLFTEIESDTEDEKAFLEAISKLKGLKVVAADDSISNSAQLYKQAVKDVEKAGYEELMSIQDAQENMKFSIKEKSGKIEELLMVVGGNKNFVMLSLYGEIDLKNISKLASVMKVKGFSELENLNKQGN